MSQKGRQLSLRVTAGSDGGDFLAALSYLTSWQGPVKEEDDPFNDGMSDAFLSAVKHVQEVRFLEYKDYEAIRKMIFQKKLWEDMLQAMAPYSGDHYHRKRASGGG